jgi:copper chaperone NosL
MNGVIIKFIASLCVGAGVAGCFEGTETAAPLPQELTRDASGYYCQMIVADHIGPKAQIFLKGREKPIWFPSVRDAFAFLMLPSEQKNIKAIYVTDMARAKNWETPEPGTWTDGRMATFVLGSDRKGGMGLGEVVPFSSEAAARAFIEKHGGSLSRMADVPEAYVFPEPDLEVPQASPGLEPTASASNE